MTRLIPARHAVNSALPTTSCHPVTGPASWRVRVPSARSVMMSRMATSPVMNNAQTEIPGSTMRNTSPVLAPRDRASSGSPNRAVSRVITGGKSSVSERWMTP